MATFEYQETVTMRAINCAACGVLFAITKDFQDRRREDHATFYCPGGHRNVYNGETEAQRLKRQLEWEKSRAKRLEDNLECERRSASAYKGQVTKLKRRASAGVCPCCNRQFANMAAHMRTKHPDFIQDARKDEPEAPGVRFLNPHKCKVSGCEQSTKTKGMCSKHYMQDYNKRKKAR